ncbi:hypothetical protein FACS1894202_03410 [Clostridia bacterium]|nr:hypothetical protein FACS1894202_03410 [Clostridia bacterium]
MVCIKRIFAIALAVCLAFSTGVPALAADVPVTEVPAAGSAIDVAAVQKQLDAAADIIPGDPKATESAAKLLKYLYAVARTDDVLFGRQRDTDAKAGQYAGSSDSDTRDMTGTIPAVVGADTNESIVFSPENAAKISIDAAAEGAIITLSAHMPDFTQMEIGDIGVGYSANNGQSTKGVAAHILPGGDKNAVYTAYLDLVAEYAKLLDARDIPILFRPFHEHTGSWFWWGRGMIPERDYIDLWRYTVDYFRDTKDVHNMLYVISPDSPNSAADYMYAYPGDEYVDVFGLDFYDSQWHGPTFEAYKNNLKTQLGYALGLASEHRKPFALTETGVQNAPDWANRPDTWFTDIMNLIKPYSVSYFLLWASWNSTQFMMPYKTSATTGHEYVDGFIRFYNDPHSVFANGTEFYGDKLSYNAQTSPPPSAPPSVSPSQPPPGEPDDDEGNLLWLWVVIIVLAGGVAAILRRRKNKGE